jgi:hypothetical protein
VWDLALKVVKKRLQETGELTGADREERRNYALPEDGHEAPWFGDDPVL